MVDVDDCEWRCSFSNSQQLKLKRGWLKLVSEWMHMDWYRLAEDDSKPAAARWLACAGKPHT